MIKIINNNLETFISTKQSVPKAIKEYKRITGKLDIKEIYTDIKKVNNIYILKLLLKYRKA